MSGRIVTVLPIGDSITFGFDASPAAGWRSSLYAAMKALGLQIFMRGDDAFANGGSGTPAGVLAIDPYNDGVNGATIPVLFGHLGDASSTCAPDICILEGGTNNITAGDSAATILADWSAYLDITNVFMAASWSQILVQQIFQRQDGLDSVAVAVNAGLPALMASKSYASKLTLCPNYAFVPPGDYVDNLHFNAAGADICGNLMAPFLAPLVRRVLASTAVG